jgi:undecaprenyl pyrophosphate phosphatase UppP
MVILVPVMAVLDVASIVIYHTAVFSVGWMMHYVLSAVTAFGGAYLGIMLLRFLAVRRGYSAFAYYCWALALFIFALYLLI